MPALGWAAIAAALALLLGADLLAGTRRNRPARMPEAAGWTLAAIGLAVSFGLLLATTSGSTAAGQFFAGWLTEYSLSMDNLLVFIILISRSPVPARLHGRVILAGIGIAVILRGAVIGLGAAALHRFGWLEYLFGAFLLYTAAQVARRRGGVPGPAEHPAGVPGRAEHRAGVPGPAEHPAGVPRPAEHPAGVSGPAEHRAGVDGARGAAGTAVPGPPPGLAARLVARLTRRHGAAGGVLVLVIALGVTDVMFALDSIPAVFGLTRDPFLVFSANVFALLGLRHLYVLVAGLLARLVYLPAGLCVILGFIGLKLIGEALRGSGVTSLGPVPVPLVNAWLSLTIIALVLAATALASTLAGRRQARQRPLTGCAH